MGIPIKNRPRRSCRRPSARASVDHPDIYDIIDHRGLANVLDPMVDILIANGAMLLLLPLAFLGFSATPAA